MFKKIVLLLALPLALSGMDNDIKRSEEKKTNQITWQELPADMHLHTLSFLDAQTLSRFMRVNHKSQSQVLEEANRTKTLASIRWTMRGPNKTIHTLADHTMDITSVAISTDTSFIVTGSNDGTAKIWSIEKLLPKETISDEELKNK